MHRSLTFTLLSLLVVTPALAQETVAPTTTTDTPAAEAPAVDGDDDATDDAASTEGSSEAEPSTDAPAADAPTDEAPASDAPAEEAPVEQPAVVEEGVAVIEESTAAVEAVVLLPEEDVDAAEKAAQARADAAAKAVTECQCVEKLAEKDAADKELAAILEKKKKLGFWYEKALTLGATGSGLYNQKFVGQVDGFALQAGAILNGMFALGYAGSEWRNTLTLEEALLATPTDDLFAPRVTKAADNLSLLSAYSYRWSRFPYVGPYAQLRGQTQVFQSYVMPGAEGITVRRTFRDGRVQDESITPGKAAFLTDFFEPLTVTESVGAFVEPPTFPPWITYNFKLGAAGQHVIVRDGFVVADDPATGEVELNQLGISNSFGSEAEAVIGGQVTEMFLWNVMARLYYPILILEETELDLIERTHLDLQTTLSLRLTKWLSADWVTKVRRQPFVLNDWQVQSQVLLTTGFSVF